MGCSAGALDLRGRPNSTPRLPWLPRLLARRVCCSRCSRWGPGTVCSAKRCSTASSRRRCWCLSPPISARPARPSRAATFRGSTRVGRWPATAALPPRRTCPSARRAAAGAAAGAVVAAQGGSAADAGLAAAAAARAAAISSAPSSANGGSSPMPMQPQQPQQQLQQHPTSPVHSHIAVAAAAGTAASALVHPSIALVPARRSRWCRRRSDTPGRGSCRRGSAGSGRSARCGRAAL